MDYLEFLETLLDSFVNYAVLLFEYIGVGVITFAGVQGLVNCIRRKPNTRLLLGKGLAMGLEFKLGSEILRTVIVRSLDEIYIVAGIIVLRSVLTILIHWEIKNEEKEAAARQDRMNAQGTSSGAEEEDEIDEVEPWNLPPKAAKALAESAAMQRAAALASEHASGASNNFSVPREPTVPHEALRKPYNPLDPDRAAGNPPAEEEAGSYAPLTSGGNQRSYTPLTPEEAARAADTLIPDDTDRRNTSPLSDDTERMSETFETGSDGTGEAAAAEAEEEPASNS